MMTSKNNFNETSGNRGSRIAILAFVMFISACASPSPTIFIGKLQKLEIIPRGAPGCPDPNAAVINGSIERITIANFCACARADFAATRTPVGGMPSDFEVEYDIGEWCEVEPTVYGGQEFLVLRAPNGRVRWFDIGESHDGRMIIYPGSHDAMFKRFGVVHDPTAIVTSCDNYGRSCQEKPAMLVSDIVEAFSLAWDLAPSE